MANVHSDWQTFVAGRAQGITVVLLALAETHPDPGALLASLEKFEQIGIAVAEPVPFGDHYLEGMRDVIDRVRSQLNQRLGREANPAAS